MQGRLCILHASELAAGSCKTVCVYIFKQLTLKIIILYFRIPHLVIFYFHRFFKILFSAFSPKICPTLLFNGTLISFLGFPDSFPSTLYSFLLLFPFNAATCAFPALKYLVSSILDLTSFVFFQLQKSVEQLIMIALGQPDMIVIIAAQTKKALRYSIT